MSVTNTLGLLLMQTENPDSFEGRPAYRRIGTYMPALIIMGLAMAVLVYLTSMQVLGWKVPALNAALFKAVSTVPGANGAPAASSTPQGMILYASPNTKEYFAGIGGNYDRLLVPWRAYFSSRRETIRELTDPAALHDLKDGVLILPSAVALSDAERADILRFRAQGGAVLATWATGTRSAKGEWAGWQFLENLGAKSMGEVALEPAARHLILNGESPLSYSQPAGQRIWLGNASERLLRFKGAGVAGRFMNWTRTPDPARKDEGAVIFSETSPTAGRAVLFAFAESAWEAQPQPVYALVEDTLNWLQRQPAIVRAAWPDGKRAAQIIEMDTEEGFPNALRFASMMHAMSYRGTFYILTSVGKQFPDVLLTLARDFEIGYHGDIHTGFKDLPPAEQQKRIDTMQADMRSVIPDTKAFTGFRAPTEGYDMNTEALLYKSGFRHHVTDPSRTEARLPAFAKIEGVPPEDSLVIIPRTQRDDINLAKENLDVAQTQQALIDDLELTDEMGALGLLSVHSQNYGSDSVLTQAMPGYLAHFKEHRPHLWLASSGQVADWWRERERFKLSAKSTGKRLEFNLTVNGKTPFSGGNLIVMLPRKGVMPEVQGLKIGMPKATVRKIDDFRAGISFETLNPGNYAYQATFE